MGRKSSFVTVMGLLAIAGLTAGAAAREPASPGGQMASRSTADPIDVTVSEGTSMAVSVSPDGRTLVMDLQGSLWTLPAAGGDATRITDVFNDARQPVWSPDSQTIAYFAFRDGSYDLWAISPDGSNQRKLTWGPFDDREPAWSRDGTRIAFASDRGTNQTYNIWVLDVASGDLRQLTSHDSNEYMPTWSPDGREIAFVREGDGAIWAVSVADGAERRVTSSEARLDAPSWGPGGQIVYHATHGTDDTRLELEGRNLTGSENAFAFRPSWVSDTEFFYVSDGKIRRRAISGGDARTVEFSATLQVAPTNYTMRQRDFNAGGPRQVLGIVEPVISPDGTQVAFTAIGNLYVMPIGGRPENLTNDRFLDTEPAWSPDGTRLAWSSDRGGNLQDIWIRDMRSGEMRQLTRLATSAMGPAWSPDGSRIAFLDVDAVWRRATVSVVDVATGQVTQIQEQLFGPGRPTWSPDGERVAISAVLQYSPRFREGTNQILTMSSRGGGDQWWAPVPHLSIDSRVGNGPVWSPDGTMMALVYEGILSIVQVAPTGEPLGPPRRVTTEMAHAPSWAGDSRTILYQSMDKLRTVDIDTGEVRDVPLDLTYTYDVPRGRVVVHAGRLVDGRTQTARENVDIIIEGNRITAVEPHQPGRAGSGDRFVDASNLTVMPGLIEFHSHLQKDFGEAWGRAALAFGVTTVRSPGGTPYEAVEDREAVDAGVRLGPRVYSTGYLMEYKRVYYKMGIAIASTAHLEMELERAGVLQHDLVKSYVRMPDLQQRRIVEFAHGIGIPVATHEIYPAALVGVDNTEHLGGTSRRGYSPKRATQLRSYADVATIFGTAGTIFCPMTSAVGRVQLVQDFPELARDPRFSLYPAWLQAQVTGGGGPGGFGAMSGPGFEASGPARMLMDIYRAGARVVAGTDSPNLFNMHGELLAYVMAGMTPFEAIEAATVTPAEALNLEAGSIEAGKLADLVIVDGNPLEDIRNTRNVRTVIANGRVHTVDELVRGTDTTPPTAQAGR